MPAKHNLIINRQQCAMMIDGRRQSIIVLNDSRRFKFSSSSPRPCSDPCWYTRKCSAILGRRMRTERSGKCSCLCSRTFNIRRSNDTISSLFNTHYYYYFVQLHRVSEKNKQNYSCYRPNYVKLPQNLTIFGKKMTNSLKSYEIHSFSTSTNSRQCKC